MRDARTWVKLHTTDAERQGYKKSLNIPKGLSESVNRRTDNTKVKRRTDNTNAKRRTDNTKAKRRREREGSLDKE